MLTENYKNVADLYFSISDHTHHGTISSEVIHLNPLAFHPSKTEI